MIELTLRSLTRPFRFFWSTFICGFFPSYGRKYQIRHNNTDMDKINRTIRILEATNESCFKTIFLTDGKPLTIRIEYYDTWVGSEGGGGCIRRKRRTIEY